MRSVLLSGFALSASFASAVTINFDSGPTVIRPASGTASFVLTGTVQYGGTPTAALSGVALGSFNAYGPGRPFSSSDASAAGNILGHFSTGIFSGPLIWVTIDSTTTAGTYTGTGQLSVRFGTAPAVLTTTAPLSFTILSAAPQPTPEPAACAALALGWAAVVRRRRAR